MAISTDIPQISPPPTKLNKRLQLLVFPKPRNNHIHSVFLKVQSRKCRAPVWSRTVVPDMCCTTENKTSVRLYSVRTGETESRQPSYSLSIMMIKYSHQGKCSVMQLVYYQIFITLILSTFQVHMVEHNLRQCDDQKVDDEVEVLEVITQVLSPMGEST